MHYINRLLILIILYIVYPVSAEELRMTFAGDLMAHDVNIAMLNYRQAYQAIEEFLSEHHLNFVNFESPLTSSIPQQGYPTFSVRPAYAQAAIEAGFNVFSLANNHSADHLRQGIIESAQNWSMLKSRYPWIQFSGLKASTDRPYQFKSIYVKEMKVGFLSVTQFNNRNDTNALVELADFRRTNEANQLLMMIRDAKAYGGFDLLVLSYHGGVEYVREIEDDKLLFYKELVDAGIDIVWGTHPHVLQPWLWYNEGIIINSAGNLISGQTWSLTSQDAYHERAYRGDSLLYSISARKNKDGKVQLMMNKPLPVSNYRHPDHGVLLVNLYDVTRFIPNMSESWKKFYQIRLQSTLRYHENHR